MRDSCGNNRLITYRSLMTKDDKDFMRACRRVMGAIEYDIVIHDSADAYKTAYDQSNGTRAAGIAKRAANQVMLEALKQFGVTDWRNINTKQPLPKLAKPSGFEGYQPDKVKDRKYNSGDGLWSKKI